MISGIISLTILCIQLPFKQNQFHFQHSNLFLLGWFICCTVSASQYYCRGNRGDFLYRDQKGVSLMGKDLSHRLLSKEGATSLTHIGHIFIMAPVRTPLLVLTPTRMLLEKEIRNVSPSQGKFLYHTICHD